jgi:3-hydroxyacyl-CoA dehydrogenase/enoyl-CoA hydratase/3-hydroxybutyryl-CoA epimerase
MAVSYKKENDGIVTLMMDMPGRSANVINEEFGKGFEAALQQLQQDEGVTGVILASAKKTFLAGADLERMYEETDPAWFFELSEHFKAGLRQLETSGKPVVALINGAALGGGFEMALACHHRISLRGGSFKIGLPEVKLGLLPGGGGVTRLTRMLGLQGAFPYLTEGKELKPDAALEAGLIDALADSVEEMDAMARAWIAAHPSVKQSWDERGYRMPGGDPRKPAVAQMLTIAPAILKKKTHGNYPAPQAIMNAAVEGAVVDFDTASRIESRYLAHVATSQVCKNMLQAFWFQLNKVNAGESRPKDIPVQNTEKVGVLGAGMMGHGIAYVSAMAGMDVVLKDVSLERAEAGKASIEALLQKRVSRGRLSKEAMDATLSRIVATGDAAALEGCDLVVEAVFEKRELKAQVTQEAEAAMREDGVFASNTSTLPITGLAEASSRPANFVGLHFFSPVDKMKLVEIIVGAQTSQETLAKAFDYVKAIKKVPIVVNDARGFYTSRVFSTYVFEGMALLAEGQPARLVESAGVQAGMPVGPLAVSDEVNLGLMTHIREQTRRDLAAEGKELDAHPGETVLQAMVSLARPGKLQKAGFYAYPEGAKKHLWPGLAEHFGKADAETLPLSTIQERLLFVQCLETVRCMEEGVCTSVADANIGSIFGWGFAPFQGGTLQYINAYGLGAFVSRCQELAEAFGARFAPPQLLLDKASANELFL